MLTLAFLCGEITGHFVFIFLCISEFFMLNMCELYDHKIGLCFKDWKLEQSVIEPSVIMRAISKRYRLQIT